MFRVGDEVVCIDDILRRDSTFASDMSLIKRGEIYTVRSITYGGGGVLLSGVYGENPTGFRSDRFRKVQRRDLTAWLSQSVKNTDKLDRPRKVRVS